MLPTNIRAERVKGSVYADGVMLEIPEAVAAVVASCLWISIGPALVFPRDIRAVWLANIS